MRTHLGILSEEAYAADTVKLECRPSSEAQVYFLNSTKRNICFNSGWGAGKTFIACFKILMLLCRFPKTRAIIGRQKYVDLAKTTMQTFFQVCPTILYDSKRGGSWTQQRGYLRLINGSEVFFMHFDDMEITSIKSLEANFLLLDQAEEIEEAIYLALDARLGRKSDAQVPKDLVEQFPDWPRNEHTGKPEVPPYSFLLINPPDEGELHYIIQRFHPSSAEFKDKYRSTNDYVESSSRENKALPKAVLDTMLSRDPKWVERYVDAKITQGEGTIHYVHPDSIVEVSVEFIKNLRRKAALSRCLDHGSTSPTCCLWFASYKGFHYCFQEYYVPDSLISDHRRAINDLSSLDGVVDAYVFSLADPSIFDKGRGGEKHGSFWSIADEYMDPSLDSPPLVWSPADKNEFATRNRINELLRFDPALTNPITGQLGSPRLFFIKRTRAIPYGCHHAIIQLKAQKKHLLSSVNGKPIYSDDRDEDVTDHAYDPTRYYCASHLQHKEQIKRRPTPSSFYGIMNRMKALKKAGYYDQYPI